MYLMRIDLGSKQGHVHGHFSQTHSSFTVTFCRLTLSWHDPTTSSQPREKMALHCVVLSSMDSLASSDVDPTARAAMDVITLQLSSMLYELDIVPEPFESV